jgi:hypothetical protein
VNCGGRVTRECALGNFAVDIRAEMPLNNGNIYLKGTKKQQILFELKLCSQSGRRSAHREIRGEDLEQVFLQVRNSSPIDVEVMEAHLIVFDEHVTPLSETSAEGYFYELKQYNGVDIHCWCCHTPKENRAQYGQRNKE